MGQPDEYYVGQPQNADCRLLQTVVFTMQNENVTKIVQLFSNTENNGLQSVFSLHFVQSKYYIFLERCKFQAYPSYLPRNLSGIFVRMYAWRGKKSTGYKKPFNGRLETRKACKPALRFLGLFAVDFLIRKHP